MSGTVYSSRRTCELLLPPSTWSAQKHTLQCPRSSDGSAGRGGGCYRKAKRPSTKRGVGYGWMGTSDASEDTEVPLGTILTCPSHPAALGGVGLTGGGAPGVKPWMAATRARTGPNRELCKQM
ncbi:hypothetical protein U0070_008363 [Myodes glareolus]|uniref:Uncharacterized protein n=1 Tax=Myodes glareolus TaxID=447135 RepID=A0AAW0IXY7_MYOGA